MRLVGRTALVALAGLAMSLAFGCGGDSDEGAEQARTAQDVSAQQGSGEVSAAAGGHVSTNPGPGQSGGQQRPPREPRGAQGPPRGGGQQGRAGAQRGSGTRPGVPTTPGGGGGFAGGPEAPPPPPPDVQEAMQDARFGEFRRMCVKLHELRREIAPLESAMATGTATQEQIEVFWGLESKISEEIKRLNAYKWDDRWSPDDRRTMSMIMHLPAS
ncbi:MAG: hypothetical protein MK101_09700 [Phycisphaerales bacterium]|nr:hypothetical protein [Phycisphaerales bacterium]